MKTIDRYVVAEMLGPFFIGVVGFIMVMVTDLLFTLVDLIINKGVPFFEVVKLLIFKLPAILVMTFPVATLFATAMALGRLSKDNEIIAIRTSGITLTRIAIPIVIFSLAVSLASFFTNEKLVPYANHVSDNIIRKVIMKQPLPDIQENIFFKDAHNRYYYLRKVNTQKKVLEDIMVYELAGGKFPRIITAHSATFEGLVWYLQEGIIHKYDEKGYVNYEATFSRMALNLTEDPLNFSKQRTTQQMDSRELKTMITSLSKRGVNTKALKVDFYLKYSIPLTCFVFALIGIPLSLPGLRSNRTWGIVITIVLIFTFYVFASVFRSLGRGGILHPLLASWFPQASFTFLGMALLIKESYFK